ncbi:MAG: hypothetical protein HY246_18875 [Proteobacteria bacterium]|nr:hypothetical protein [Pseudomonadota bacterium]
MWWRPGAASPHRDPELIAVGELTLPILVANGVSDIVVPAYGSYVILQGAQNAKLVLHPDAGHGFQSQYIDDFAGDAH